MDQPSPAEDKTIRDLTQKVRGLRWLIFWAFLFGLGIGFYLGYVVGLNLGRTELPAVSQPSGEIR